MIQSKSQMEWLEAVEKLTKLVEEWAQSDEWATRRVTVSVRDGEGGRYEAPGLLLQKETKRVLLEPVSYRVPEVDGLVDLYLMPRYDDIASLYLKDGEWSYRYQEDDDSSTLNLDYSPAEKLSKTKLLEILNAMTSHETE